MTEPPGAGRVRRRGSRATSGQEVGKEKRALPAARCASCASS